MKATEICNIIKACGENSVSEISFHGVTIKFQAQRNELADTLGPASDFPDTPVIVSEISKQDTQRAEDFDRAQILDSEDALAMIENPVLFEKNEIDRDIETYRSMTQ